MLSPQTMLPAHAYVCAADRRGLGDVDRSATARSSVGDGRVDVVEQIATRPRALISPVPWRSALYERRRSSSFSGIAVNCSTPFARFGVSAPCVLCFEQRDDAGDHGRRHAGARQLHELLARLALLAQRRIAS